MDRETLGWFIFIIEDNNNNNNNSGMCDGATAERSVSFKSRTQQEEFVLL